MHHQKSEPGIICGTRPLMEALIAGKEVDKVLIQKNSLGDRMSELRKMLTEKKIPIQFVPIEKLDTICQKNRLRNINHQGVLAYISAVTYYDIEQVVPAIFERSETPLILVLDEITDVRNFGAIARTAECSGVHAIIIPKKGSAQINADAVKTSAGALNHIPVCKVDSLKTTLKFLKDSGLQIIACSEKAADNLQEADYTVPTAVVMGSEESGISVDIIKTADHLVKIPLFGKIASLNVSVATGVILYEAIRQRYN
jgi:23S rRNA (guanosine2251-2'-O)-methyltransferase